MGKQTSELDIAPVHAERGPAAAGMKTGSTRQATAVGIGVQHTPRMLAQRVAMNAIQRRAAATGSATSVSTAPAQLTEMDAIERANELSTVGQFTSWQAVHGSKDSFDAEGWESIVAAYNRGNTGGVRLRYTPPKPKPLPVPQKPSPTPTATDHLKTAGSVAGTLGTLVTGAQTVHETGLGSALQHVPVLGALSSTATAVTKSELAEDAYRRGDLSTTARHQLGSYASGIKAASDSLTVASMGVSAPLTVPVSTVASGINTLTSLPEYAKSAKTVYDDPLHTVAKTMMSASSAKESLSSTYESVSSKVSGWIRSGTDMVGLTTPEEDRPPPTMEERRQAEEEEARKKLEKAKTKASEHSSAKQVEHRQD